MQIVVMISRDPYDPFMGAMQQLKAAMLAHYALERQLAAPLWGIQSSPLYSFKVYLSHILSLHVNVLHY